MDYFSLKLCITTLVVVAAAFLRGVYGDAIITGSVFCDQCKDGQISLYDYPIYGIPVAIVCAGSNKQPTMVGEQTTNWIGGYGMRFEGNPDFTTCYVQVLNNGQDLNGCSAATGYPKPLRKIFGFFGMDMYTVDPLISQPSQPMPFCSNSPVLIPALPSACPHQKWKMEEYRCYWKAVTPDTKVAVVFGLIVGSKYGRDMTLSKALDGKGEVYKTLLREATTALLNSYNSVEFAFQPLDVIETMNLAILGTPRQALHTAVKFIKANSGNGCKFVPCKSEK